MTTKTVSQLNADGYFVGQTEAFESPLEPGLYLIPGGAVDADPPAVPEGQRARWNNGWQFESIPQPEPEPTEPELTPEERLTLWRRTSQITMRQCRLHLLATGKLNLVQPAIDSLPEPQRSAANIEWEYGAVVQRSSPLIAQLAPVLGWNTPEEIDQQFIQASQL